MNQESRVQNWTRLFDDHKLYWYMLNLIQGCDHKIVDADHHCRIIKGTHYKPHIATAE